MVVGDLHGVDTVLSPMETQAVWVVDPNSVLSDAVVKQRVKFVSWRNS